MVKQVATNIHATFIAECSVYQDIDEQDSTMLLFTTKVESVEDSLIQFNDQKAEVEALLLPGRSMHSQKFCE